MRVTFWSMNGGIQFYQFHMNIHCVYMWVEATFAFFTTVIAAYLYDAMPDRILQDLLLAGFGLWGLVLF